MSNPHAPILNFPLSPRANHGLWTSAYHLIHPESASNQFKNGLSWPDQDESYLEFSAPNKKYFKPSNEVSSLNEFSGKDDRALLEKNLVERSSLGVRFIPRCLDELGDWVICRDDNCTNHEPNATPRKKSLGCPGASDLEEFNLSSINLISSFSCSTLSSFAVDFNAEAVNKLLKQRSKYLESILVGSYNSSFLWDDRLSNQPTTQLLSSSPQSPIFALSMLEEAMADCLGDEIGMIHAPVSVASRWINETLSKHSEDYPDGMGTRSVLRTDIRGDVIVSGAGYGYAMGPGDVVPGPNQAYVYGTSFVYLNWDDIRVQTLNLREMTDTKTNLTTARAEQEMYPIFNPCCIFAVLVDLC